MSDKTSATKPRTKFFALRIRAEDNVLFDQVFAFVNAHGWSALGISTGEPVSKTNLAAQAIKLLAAKAKTLPKAPASAKKK